MPAALPGTARSRRQPARWLILGLLLAVVSLLSGCIAPPPYTQAGNFTPAALTGSGEILPGTWPAVILSHNTEVTRTYLATIRQAVPAGPNDLVIDDFFGGIRQTLLNRFGPPPGPTLTASNDLRMIFDATVTFGPMSGAQNQIALTGVFIDARQNVIDTVHGQGITTIPFPAANDDEKACARAAFADFAANLARTPALDAFQQQRQQEEARAREQARGERRLEIARRTDTDEAARDLFQLTPFPDQPVSQVTELIITWKNRRLDSLVRNTKTSELRDYVDRIEHTIYEATDAEEKQKDQAQSLLAAGTAGSDACLDLARAYRLRIEVLKPILAALKEEVANREK